ncbi:MAG: hypothetical protein MRK01_02395 [Candidatus Scalindua sp.]|nr:hypothetical protein [Candidatus Scalindua sp.]
MTILFYGSTLFVIALIMHFVLWRIRLPKRQTKILCLIFFVVLASGSTFFFLYPDAIALFAIHTPVTIFEHFQIWQYYGILTLAYINTYSAIEVDSPSLLIVEKISKASGAGLSRETMGEQMDDSILVKPRLNDLITHKIAQLSGGKYRLKAKGIFMACIITFYRNLMRVGKGG